jgi:hypothetical protein
MRSLKAVVCLFCVLLISLNCSVQSKPNEPIIDESYIPSDRDGANKLIFEAKRILTDIAKKNHLLALELGKLPELQDRISVNEVESLKNIRILHDIDPIIFNAAFDKMYKEGIPEIRKFSTPLQALFWLSGNVQFSKQNNPLLNYDLESFLNKAWGAQGVVLLKEDVKKIRNERVYVEDKKELESILSTLSDGSRIFGIKSFQDEVRDRWLNFEEVTDRLNSPRLVFKYIKPNLYFPMTLRRTPPSSPKQTFKSKTGNCASQALFVNYSLKKAGYDSVVIRYDCTFDFCGPKRGRLSYTNPTPYHWTVAYKEGGAIYELDAGRHYMGGPYKSYSEVAGGNPFVLKSWRDYKY